MGKPLSVSVGWGFMLPSSLRGQSSSWDSSKSGSRLTWHSRDTFLVTHFLQQGLLSLPKQSHVWGQSSNTGAHEDISHSNHSVPSWYTMAHTNIVLAHSSSCRTSLVYHALQLEVSADVLNVVRQMLWWYSRFFEIKYLKNHWTLDHLDSVLQLQSAHKVMWN